MAHKAKKQAVYCPPELVPHVFCVIVLNLAIHKNPEAKKLYEQLKVDLNLPGCQKRFSPLEHLDIALAKAIAKEAGYSYEKGPPAVNQMVLMREMMRATQRLVSPTSAVRGKNSF